MRPSIAKQMWTDPVLPMAQEFCRMSYALFRIDGDTGRVVAARTPDRGMLSVGHCIQDSLAFCPDALSYMTRSHGGEAPLFILTRAGIGILSSRYHMAAGLGLYLHIHARPASVARLLNRGVLGDPQGGAFAVSREIISLGDGVTRRDEPSYSALLTAWKALQTGARGVFAPDARSSVSLRQLRDGIDSMADFAGCGLTFTLPREAAERADLSFARVNCYRPIALEALLLCLLSEVRDRSATRLGVCCLNPFPHGGAGLSMTLRYPLYPCETPESAVFYDTVHRYLENVGETWGMDICTPARPLPAHDLDGLSEVTVDFDWLWDPSILASSDIKTRIALSRDEKKELPLPQNREEIRWEDVF